MDFVREGNALLCFRLATVKATGARNLNSKWRREKLHHILVHISAPEFDLLCAYHPTYIELIHDLPILLPMKPAYEACLWSLIMSMHSGLHHSEITY